MPTKKEIIAGVSGEVQWWIGQRLRKFGELGHGSMAINPFMAPLLVGIHAHANFEELAEFLIGGHFMVGHSTGFGKLVDEKILPKVFGTTKLTAAFRKSAPYNLSVFSEIDHLVLQGRENVLLSVKAGRWTIQLGQAMQLNHSLKQLVDLRTSRNDVTFSKIVVGVFYGTNETLTDKFNLIRGIRGRVQHDVVDITNHVDVFAGRRFWAWMNLGETKTQDWVLDGVLDGLSKSRNALQEAARLLESFKSGFTKEFEKCIDGDGKIDWHAILRTING